MATPIEAKCRRCGNEFTLFEVADRNTGDCPRCQYPLSPEWTFFLLLEALRAQSAQHELLTALRRLVDLPGNLELIPQSVLGTFFEEVGWKEELIAEPELIREEVRRLQEQAEEWERLHPEARPPGVPLAEGLRRLASRIRLAPPATIRIDDEAEVPRHADAGVSPAGEND